MITAWLMLVVISCGFFSSFSQQDDQIPAAVTEISPSVALWALQTDSDAQPMKRGLDLATDSVLVYRVAVSAEGRVLRSEKISGDSKLQTAADSIVNTWNFKQVAIKGSASSWQSLLDVCFFREGGYMLPCYFSETQSKEGQLGGAPARLLLVGNVKKGRTTFHLCTRKKAPVWNAPKSSVKSVAPGK
jgi:hypothetical protein